MLAMAFALFEEFQTSTNTPPPRHVIAVEGYQLLFQPSESPASPSMGAFATFALAPINDARGDERASFS